MLEEAIKKERFSSGFLFGLGGIDINNDYILINAQPKRCTNIIDKFNGTISIAKKNKYILDYRIMDLILDFNLVAFLSKEEVSYIGFICGAYIKKLKKIAARSCRKNI